MRFSQGQPYHPSGLPTPGSAAVAAAAELVDPLEFFFWELTGFLVVRGAMDSALLAAANAVLDRHAQAGHGPAAPAAAAAATAVTTEPDDSTEPQQLKQQVTKRMSGTSHPSFNIDLLADLQTPADRAPFIEMLAHPALVQRLSWMMGGHFRAQVRRTALTHSRHHSSLTLKWSESQLLLRVFIALSQYATSRPQSSTQDFASEMNLSSV
jgi:hypothetical protein